jgi:CheY-like chemotaxis protein
VNPRKLVLIVEDDADALHEMAGVLAARGYEVATAINGRQALHMMTAATDVEPCAIVLDLSMPVMSGWELLAVMRSYSRLSRIPVVLITAHWVDTDTRVAFEALLKKPFLPEELVEVVGRVCSSARKPI